MRLGAGSLAGGPVLAVGAGSLAAGPVASFDPCFDPCFGLGFGLYCQFFSFCIFTNFSILI